MARDTLLDFFRAVVEREGEYLVYDNGFRPHSYSYADLGRAAHNVAARLQAAGIGRGDTVVLWSENRPAWVAAFWGAVLRGVAVAPIDEHHSNDFFAHVNRLVGPKLILLGDEIEYVPQPGHPPVWRLAELDWISTPATAEPVSISPDDPAQILFTSGATAEPKGVVITHRNILANIVPVEREIVKNLHFARPFSPIRFLNLLPLSHMFGQAMAIFMPPVLGGTVIFQRSQEPREIIRQIHDRRISVLVCVPKILDVLRGYLSAEVSETATPAPAGERFWWRWWRYRRAHRLFGMKFWSVIVGGAALEQELEAYWANLGWVVVQGYGLTEAAPIVTLNHPFHARRGTVGKPIAGVKVRLAADGEVMVSGGNVTTGYYNDPEATREAFEDGWFHTGDIGAFDADGYLIIKGRKKEMIVLSDGRNVFPEDVERVLDATAGVKEAAVVGLPGEGGERVHAVLVLNNGTRPEDVVRQANTQLEEHQRVAGYTIWNGAELPRTEGTRKLKRRQVAALLGGGSRPRRGEPREDMEALFARWTAGRAVDGTTSLDELGISSLDRVEMMVALERHLGAPVDEDRFAAARTLAELESLGQARPDAADSFKFPRWNRLLWARLWRAFHLHVWLLNLARIFVWVSVEGRENLFGVRGPVLFAANHQSFFDTPVLFIALPWRWRLRLVPTMRKEFFDAHFHPAGHSIWKRFTNSLNYYLACLTFTAVPLPQREAGARRTLRYLGDLAAEGWSPLIFPEGRHALDDEVGHFLPGVGMIGSKLQLEVVPVRLRGVNRVLRPGWKFPRPGHVRVVIGKPMRLEGDDYLALARAVEQRIKEL
jgi:long-chain acyl-CoA synthetase